MKTKFYLALVLNLGCIPQAAIRHDLYRESDACIRTNPGLEISMPEDIRTAAAAVIIEEFGIFHLCSATAIGPHTLLTAGHCLLNPKSISKIYARGGDDIRNRAPNGSVPWTEYTVTGTVVHPLYKGEGMDHDLALVHIYEPWKGAIIPVENSPDFEYPPGTEFMTAGYGISANDKDDSGQLRMGIDHVIEDFEWNVRTSGAAQTSAGMPGDSGMGAIYRGKVIGVLSTLDSSYRNIYVKTTTHRSFIDGKCK